MFPDGLLNISSPSFTGSPGVSLTKTGPGTLEFGSDAGISLTGALNVKEGTLTIFNALDVGTTGSAKTRVAALEIANATANVAGGLTITSGGVLALGAGFAINGPLVNGSFVPNAALTADGGTIQTLAALPVPNNVTLAHSGVILDSHGFNSTFSGTFTGSGGLTKINAGTVILTANNSYRGDTTIQEGTLVAGTQSAQKISTALGTGNVFLGGGTLRTTSATTGKPLQINVGGSYTQDPGGTLALGIGGLLLGQYDHVFAQGNATVHGTLEVSSLNGFRPSAGDAFAVLLTKGTRTGLFDRLNDFFNNNPNITARLQPVEVYAPNGVALVYVAAAPGPSPNPIPPIIDVIPTPLPPVAIEEPLPPSFVVAALNPTIEQLTSMFEIPFSGANTQRFNLDNRLAEIQRGSTGFVSTVPTVPPNVVRFYHFRSMTIPKNLGERIWAYRLLTPGRLAMS